MPRVLPRHYAVGNEPPRRRRPRRRRPPGAAGNAVALHLHAYASVYQLVGQLVEAGSIVYDAIALTSENIAVHVERALVKLGERLTKTAARLSSKFSGPIAIALLVKEVAEHGLGIVQSYIDDCFELVEEIRAWAEVQAERLRTFHNILSIIEALPGVDANGLTATTNDVVRQVEHALSDVKVEFPVGDKSPEKDKLDEALADLGSGQTAGGQGGNQGGAAEARGSDDGDRLMAPGPLGGSTPSLPQA
jgi:hypothetical protein